MIDLGAAPDAIEVWIGPGICAEHYEVSPEMIEKFRAAFPASGLSPGGRRLDLARIAADQLTAAGLRPANIADAAQCTFEHAALYHSYRRDSSRAGRMLTVIAMTGAG